MRKNQFEGLQKSLSAAPSQIGWRGCQIPLKNKQLMRPVNNPFSLNAPGIYNISCSCGHSYIGQTGWTVSIQKTEHRHHLYLWDLEKSVVVLHGWITGHTIKFEGSALLYRSLNWQQTKDCLRIFRNPIVCQHYEQAWSFAQHSCQTIR